MGSWPKDISFPGCHLIVHMWSWNLCIPDRVVLGVRGRLANSDSAQKCSHVRTLCVLPTHALRGQPTLLWTAHISLAFPFRRCCLMGRFTFGSDGRRASANAWAFERSHAARGTCLLSPARPQFQGSACNRFESYIRSHCHFLAPLILSPANPSNVAELVAAFVLEEFVSISLGENLLRAALQYVFQLKNSTKTFHSHRTEEIFLCLDAFGRNWLLPGLGIHWSLAIHIAWCMPRLICLWMANVLFLWVSKRHDTLWQYCVISLLHLWHRKTKHRSHPFSCSGWFIFYFQLHVFRAERKDVCSIDRMRFYLITVVIFIIHISRPHFSGHY